MGFTERLECDGERAYREARCWALREDCSVDEAHEAGCAAREAVFEGLGLLGEELWLE